jgi:L-iditol 2-dehydrogenase
MKALVYHGPRELRLEDVGDPEAGPGEVLVAVAGCGVCGSDLHGYLGHSRARVPPLVLGHELAGRVAAVGSGVGEDLLGRVVAVRPTLTCGRCEPCRAEKDNLCRERRLMGLNAPGGLAGLVAVPASNAIPVATESVVGASIVEVLANAIHVVALAGDCRSIGIAGGGALGLLTLFMAREAGIAERLLTEPHAGRRAMAEDLGATAVADPRDLPLTRLTAERSESGVDVTMDAVGLGETRRDAIAAAAPGGRVVLLGLEEERSEIDFADVVRREIELKGSFAYTAAEFARAAELFPSLADTLLPLINTEPIEAGPDVFAGLADRRDHRVKVVLVP